MNKHTTKTNLSLAVVCLATILVTVHVQAQDVAASGGDKEAAVLDTIAQINHINWVVSTIKTYNNALVLEGESSPNYNIHCPCRLCAHCGGAVVVLSVANAISRSEWFVGRIGYYDGQVGFLCSTLYDM